MNVHGVIKQGFLIESLIGFLLLIFKNLSHPISQQKKKHINID